MNKELIPIITAYLGAECSFLAGGGVTIVRSLDWPELRYLGTKNIKNFKLHLRPLYSITKEEFVELGEKLQMPKYAEKTASKIIWSDYHERFFQIFADNDFDIMDISSELLIKSINHLRSKGFCLDQCLVDADLVKWVNK